MPATHDRMHGSAPDRARTVMLVLDMFSNFDFEDGARLARLAVPIARRIRDLKARLQGRVPCIYVNDNLGRWRSDFGAVVRRAESSAGAAVARLLQPHEHDYCLLKPKHSAFFDTPLATLLQALGARRILLHRIKTAPIPPPLVEESTKQPVEGRCRWSTQRVPGERNLSWLMIVHRAAPRAPAARTRSEQRSQRRSN